MLVRSQRHRPGLGSRSGQFPLHLSRVPPVRYQDGVVLPHQDHAGRTAEAGEVADVREIGNKEGVTSSPAQLRPQTLDAAGQFHSAVALAPEHSPQSSWHAGGGMNQSSPPPANGGPTARLLLSAPDRPGLVAAVANFIYSYGGDVTQADQHNDEEEGMFFQRVEFRLDNFQLSRDELPAAISELAAPLNMNWSVRYSDDERRVAVLVSRQPHCLVDLLGRWYAHELPGQPVLVASNHPDHAGLVSRFGVPYDYLPVASDTRASQEEALLQLLGRGPGRASRIGPLHAESSRPGSSTLTHIA